MKFKKIMAALMVAVMVTGMAGCGAKNATTTDGSTTAQKTEEGNTTTDGGNTTTTTDGSTTTTDGSSTTTDTKQTPANVDISLKAVVEGAEFNGIKVASGLTYQDVAKDFNVKYYGADISDEFAWEQAPDYFSSDDGAVEIELGLLLFDGGDISYGANIYGNQTDYGEAYSQVTFNLDGSFSGAYTTVDEKTWSSGKKIGALEGCGSYLDDSKAFTLVDFIKAIGLDKKDANFVTTAEAIMSGQMSSCSGSFNTEYGKADVSLTCFTVNTEFPTGYLEIKFTEAGAPVKAVNFSESYYNNIFAGGKTHMMSLSVSNTTIN